MSEDKELQAINAMLEAVKLIDSMEDRQRAVEYVLRRVVGDYYSNQTDAISLTDQMAKQQYAAGLMGGGNQKLYRGIV